MRRGVTCLPHSMDMWGIMYLLGFGETWSEYMGRVRGTCLTIIMRDDTCVVGEIGE